MGLLPQLIPGDVLVLHCPLCQFHSHLLNNIEHHFDQCHPDRVMDYAIYRCGLCLKVASCRRFMLEHISLIHPGATAAPIPTAATSTTESEPATDSVVTVDQPDSLMSVYFSGKLYSKSSGSGSASSYQQAGQGFSPCPDSPAPTVPLPPPPSGAAASQTTKIDFSCIFCHSAHPSFSQLQLHYGLTHGIRNIDRRLHMHENDEEMDENSHPHQHHHQQNLLDDDGYHDSVKEEADIADNDHASIHDNTTGPHAQQHQLTLAVAPSSSSLTPPQLTPPPVPSSLPGGATSPLDLFSSHQSSHHLQSPLKSLAGQISNNLHSSRSTLFNLIMQQQQHQQQQQQSPSNHPTEDVHLTRSSPGCQSSLASTSSSSGPPPLSSTSSSLCNNNSSNTANDQSLGSLSHNLCSVGLSLPFPMAAKVPPLTPRLNGQNAAAASWFSGLAPQLITSPILSSLHSHFANATGNSSNINGGAGATNGTGNNCSTAAIINTGCLNGNAITTLSNGGGCHNSSSGGGGSANGLPNLHQQMMQAYAAAAAVAHLPSLAVSPNNNNSPATTNIMHNSTTNNNEHNISNSSNNNCIINNNSCSSNNSNSPCNNNNINLISNDLFQIPKGFPSVFSSVMNNISHTLNNNNLGANSIVCLDNSLDLSSTGCNNRTVKHEKTTAMSGSESDRSSFSLSPTIPNHNDSGPVTVANNNSGIGGGLDEAHIYSMKRVVGLSRTNLPFQARKILFGWLTSHLREPYPSEEEKIRLANETSLSRTTVNNWFINARRRYVKPLLQGKLGMTSGVLKSMLESSGGSGGGQNINTGGAVSLLTNEAARSGHLGGSGGGALKRKSCMTTVGSGEELLLLQQQQSVGAPSPVKKKGHKKAVVLATATPPTKADQNTMEEVELEDSREAPHSSPGPKSADDSIAVPQPPPRSNASSNASSSTADHNTLHDSSGPLSHDNLPSAATALNV